MAKTLDIQKPRAAEPEPELNAELAAIFFTRHDILKILDVHSDTFDRWRRNGNGPAQTVLPGRRIVFSKASFFEWVKNREEQPKRRRAVRSR